MKKIRCLLFCFICFIIHTCVAQTIGHDTTIAIFSNSFIDGSNKQVTKTVSLPDTSYKYQQIIMHYALSCPVGGCDPYDRIGSVYVLKTDSAKVDTFEIARIMTPFAKNCSWDVDVTDFRPLLSDSCTLQAYILTYASGGKGFDVTMSLQYIGGHPTSEAYKVLNLWRNNPASDRWEYGNPYSPFDNHLYPLDTLIDPMADSAKVDVFMSGHGEGNVDDGAEFGANEAIQHLIVDTTHSFSHNFWYSICGSNPCSPQSGTWQYNRLGWCPGMASIAWSQNITSAVRPGFKAGLSYQSAPYINVCSPDTCNNPSANCPFYGSGETCAYGSYHTEPFLYITSTLIFMRDINPSSIDEHKKDLRSVKIFPNPAKNIFTIQVNGFVPSQIKVLNVMGQEIRSINNVQKSKKITIDMSDAPAGVYVIQLFNASDVLSKQLILQ